MQTHQKTFRVTRMAKVLCVSPSGFYALSISCKQTNKRQQAQQYRDERIKAAFDDSIQRNGARCIQADLAEQGIRSDVKTIAKSMNRQHVNLK